MYNNQFGYNPYYQQIKYPTAMPQTMPQAMDFNMAQFNNQMTSQPIQNRTFLNGKTVDSLEVVKAIEYPLDGSTSYFPLTDGSAIVTKQLQNDGSSKITIFKPVSDESEKVKYITNDDMEKALKKIDLSKLEDIEDGIKEIKKELKEFKETKKKKEN